MVTVTEAAPPDVVQLAELRTQLEPAGGLADTEPLDGSGPGPNKWNTPLPLAPVAKGLQFDDWVPDAVSPLPMSKLATGIVGRL